MNDLLNLDKKLIWHPFTPLVSEISPILIDKAEGVYLHTADGRKIIDAISSWWVNLHGHGNEYIAKAISAQAMKMEHVIFAGFTHEPAIRISQRVLSILPDNQVKIFYSDNGSTAVEVAIKMALQYWHNNNQPKKRVIALEGAYHGDTFGAMSVAERGPFNAAFQSHLFNVEFIPFPTEENFEEVKRKLFALTQSKDVAAFIYEPLLQGTAGMRMYSGEMLDEMISIAHQNETLCIADEVLTGFGRTGKLFASLYCKNQPDIMCLSKGITGGFMPFGATTCNQKVLGAFESSESIKTLYHGHSYTANPISCAAANASLDLLLSADCRESLIRINISHKKFIERVKSERIKDIRCLGTVMAVELKDEGNASYFSALRKIIYPYFLKKNILLRPLGNIIYILPPYVIKDEELETIYNEIENFLKMDFNPVE